MSNSVFFKGNKLKLSGKFPQPGKEINEFNLIDTDLSVKFIGDFPQGKKIIYIFPSIDTPVCATSIKKLEMIASVQKEIAILCISADLPFAQARFIKEEKISKLKFLSSYQSSKFGVDNGVLISEGPLKGLLTRSIILLDSENNVLHSQLVTDITEEPDYDSLIDKLES
ncbi:thiol peroxidase [Escherichia coli B9:H18]|nr:thiol peroxidase [Escherichia coli]